MAERTGLEPATPGVTGRYSNRLNYRSLVLLARRAVRTRGEPRRRSKARPAGPGSCRDRQRGNPLWYPKLSLARNADLRAGRGRQTQALERTSVRLADRPPRDGPVRLGAACRGLSPPVASPRRLTSEPGGTGLRVCGSAGLRVCGSAGLRVFGSSGLRVFGSSGLRVFGSAGFRLLAPFAPFALLAFVTEAADADFRYAALRHSRGAFAHRAPHLADHKNLPSRHRSAQSGAPTLAVPASTASGGTAAAAENCSSAL